MSYPPSFPVALQFLENLGHLTWVRFRNRVSRHSDRAPWTGVCPLQGLLPTQDNTTQKDADKHSRLEQDSNPQPQYQSGQNPHPRQCGHCDRRLSSFRF